MDPNVTLSEIRELIDRIEETAEFLTGLRLFGVTSELRSDAADLVEKFRALDEWMTRGGFTPASWTVGHWPRPVVDDESARIAAQTGEDPATLAADRQAMTQRHLPPCLRMPRNV